MFKCFGVPMGFSSEMRVKTSRKEEIIDITEDANKAVKQSGIRDGICLVHAMHTTAGIIVNENYDPLLKEDILSFLSKAVQSGIWKHDQEDGNASAHIKSIVLGQSQSIPVKGGRLALGRWQGICLVELDGPKERTISISVV
jgi:secondary thiamine-phosphate synthase enzyme